jgi:hypothetical protein
MPYKCYYEATINATTYVEFLLKNQINKSIFDEPTIAGIAKKKENSAATGVERPAIHPPLC